MHDDRSDDRSVNSADEALYEMLGLSAFDMKEEEVGEGSREEGGGRRREACGQGDLGSRQAGVGGRQG